MLYIFALLRKQDRSCWKNWHVDINGWSRTRTWWRPAKRCACERSILQPSYR